MKAVGTNNGQLLLWHKSCHKHPIFNPKFAQENLVSLIESISLLLVAVFMAIISLHLMSLNNLLEKDTLTWLLIESSSRRMMFWASNSQFLEKAYVFIVLVLALVALIIIRRFFNIAKANLHPNSKREILKYIAKGKIGNTNLM